MQKTILYGKWHRYKSVSIAVTITGLVACLAICIYALRANNLKMTELKQAVYAADQNNGNVETALNNLRQFVYGHMNTNLRTGTSTEPPIQLANQFNKAIAAEQARVVALGGANQVYVAAQSQCETASVPLTVRAQCIQDYVSTHAADAPQLNLPPKELYTFDFTSPTWSPDLAGWSLILSVAFALMLLVRIFAGRYINRYLKE